MMGIFDFFRGSKEERIANRYMNALREAGEFREMTFNRAEQQILILDGHGSRVHAAFLGNLAREIGLATESEHDAIYRRYAASQRELAREIPTEYAAVRSALRVLLKDEEYPSYIALQTKLDFPDGNHAPHVLERVAGDVIACCVEEMENGLRFVTESDLATWNVSASQALQDARANVCSLECEIHATGHAHFVFADDSFQAARLVNTSLFADRPVRGRWVAVVPDRNTFFVADSDDLEGLESLARLAEKQCEAGDRLISGLPFVLEDGQWREFEPPEAVRVPFSNVGKRFALARWTDYKAALERTLERSDEDVFVASLTLYENESTKSYWSDVVWSKDVDTILPPADRVVFYEGEGRPLRAAPWANVARVMAHAMPPLDGPPTRFRVNEFPTPEQFVAMGASVV